jgi:hypothetical protein
MIKFLELNSHDRPRNPFFSELIIIEKAKKFKLSREILIGEEDKSNASQISLFRKINDITSLYFQFFFRADFVQRIYRDFGYLGFSGFMGVIKY